MYRKAPRTTDGREVHTAHVVVSPCAEVERVCDGNICGTMRPLGLNGVGAVFAKTLARIFANFNVFTGTCESKGRCITYVASNLYDHLGVANTRRSIP